ELRARHLGAVEATRALDPDALGTGAHRGLHGLLHGTAELDATGELLRDTLGDQLRVDLGLLDLEDVQLHLLAGELLELAADAVGLGATATDHDARAGGVDVHPHPVTGALDLDLGDTGPLHPLGQELADRDVLTDVGLVQLVGVPPALVVGGDAETEPVRVDLLAHQAFRPFLVCDVVVSAAGSTTSVMWLVRLRIRVARPCARGRHRFIVGPWSTVALVTTSVARSRSSVPSALATADSRTLYTVSLAACGANCSSARASSTGRPRTMSTTRRAFIGVIRTKRAEANAPGWSPSSESRRALVRRRSVTLIALSPLPPRSAAAALPVVLDVPAVGAGRRELAQLVTDHRVGHEHRDVLAAVVHGERVADHGRHDHRAARPRLDHVVGPCVVLRVHLLDQVVVDEGALLQAARHLVTSLLSASCRSCGDGRSGHRWPCACACGPRACPTGTPGGDHRRSCPRHHRAGGRRGS